MCYSVHILGAGALGRLWAARLSAAGWQPILLQRKANLGSAIAPTSIQQKLWEPGATEPFELPVSIESTQHPSTIERLIVMTKAWQSVGAVNAIKPYLSANASLLIVQNGLGAQQQIATDLKAHPVWAASTTDGAWLDRDKGVHHAGFGLTRIGALTPGTQPDWIKRLSQVAGLKIETAPKIEPVLLTKVAVNSAINGLTALYNCRNGELLTEPLWPKVQALCVETEQLLNSLDKPLDAPLEGQVRHVLEITADNISSTCQDMRAGRPTELAFINGYLLRSAEAIKVDLPAHRKLMEQLQRNGLVITPT